jgi:outer membrane lipoprotein-sorting protein
MSNCRRFASLCLWLLMSVSQSLTVKATGAPADADPSSMLPEGKNGAALVDQVAGHVNSIGNYKFDGSQEAQNGNKVLKAVGTFYFKPANSMRVEVKSFGSKSGSVLVKRADGSIKAKGGPQMFGMKMSMQPDSRLLKMPNGFSAVECDLASLLKRLKQEAASGYKMVSANEPMNVERLGTRAIVLESQKADDSGTAVVDRVFIDPVKKLPVQWDLFVNGKFQSRSKFQNYETNIQMDESQFNL